MSGRYLNQNEVEAWIVFRDPSATSEMQALRPVSFAIAMVSRALNRPTTVRIAPQDSVNELLLALRDGRVQAKGRPHHGHEKKPIDPSEWNDFHQGNERFVTDRGQPFPWSEISFERATVERTWPQRFVPAIGSVAVDFSSDARRDPLVMPDWSIAVAVAWIMSPGSDLARHAAGLAPGDAAVVLAPEYAALAERDFGLPILLSGEEGRAELWRALAAGQITGTAIDGPKRREISAAEWQDLEIVAGKSGRGIALRSTASGAEWSSPSIRSVEALALWPIPTPPEPASETRTRLVEVDDERDAASALKIRSIRRELERFFKADKAGASDIQAARAVAEKLENPKMKEMLRQIIGGRHPLSQRLIDLGLLPPWKKPSR
jgi:hypothetical protein